MEARSVSRSVVSWVIRSEAGFLALRYSEGEAITCGEYFSNRWSDIRVGRAIMRGYPIDTEKAIARSEKDGGVWMRDIPRDGVAQVKVGDIVLEIKNSRDGWMIKGHPKMCPDWRRCCIHGSTWGGSMLKMDFLGVGMHIEMTIQGNDGIILTNTVKEINVPLA